MIFYPSLHYFPYSNYLDTQRLHSHSAPVLSHPSSHEHWFHYFAESTAIGITTVNVARLLPFPVATEQKRPCYVHLKRVYVQAELTRAMTAMTAMTATRCPHRWGFGWGVCGCKGWRPRRKVVRRIKNWPTDRPSARISSPSIPVVDSGRRCAPGSSLVVNRPPRQTLCFSLPDIFLE